MASASDHNIDVLVYGIVHKDKLFQSRHPHRLNAGMKYGESVIRPCTLIPAYRTWRICNHQSLTSAVAYLPTP